MLKKIGLATLLTIWSVVPLVAILLVALHPPAIVEHSIFWLAAALLWSLASIVLFVTLLAVSRKAKSASSFFHGLVGLICTLILGLPAMIFSAIPLIGGQIDLLQSFNSDEALLSLGQEKSGGEPSPSIKYLIGIDISTSFLKDVDDDRMLKVLSAIRSIVSLLPSLVREGDVMEVYVFADSSSRLIRIQGKADLVDLQRRLAQLVSDSIQNSGTVDDVLDRELTDVLGFLESRVCPSAEAVSGKNNHQLKVILFSDFVQSAPQPRENSESFDERLRRIENCFRSNKDQVVRTVAFFGPQWSDSGVDRGINTRDIRRYFEVNCNKGWESISLASFAEEFSDERRVFSIALLFRSMSAVRPLYLKYLKVPEFRPISAAISLPKGHDTDRVVFGLSPKESNSEVELTVFAGDSDDFVLGAGESYMFSRRASEPYPLKVELGDGFDLPENGKSRLAVALPDRGEIFDIPIVFIQVVNRPAAVTLGIVVLLLHLFPVVLAVVAYRDLFNSDMVSVAAENGSM